MINIQKIVNLYAKSFNMIVKERKIITTVETNLKNLQELLKENKDFVKLIVSPTISPYDKKNSLKAIISLNNFNKIIENFLLVLLDNKRLYLLSHIIERMIELFAEEKDETKVTLTVASELSEKQLCDIKQYLEETLSKKIILDLKISPHILGGMIVQIGSQMFDNSFAIKLKRIHKRSIDAVSSL